jgi:hypothetical protein
MVPVKSLRSRPQSWGDLHSKRREHHRPREDSNQQPEKGEGYDLHRGQSEGCALQMTSHRLSNEKLSSGPLLRSKHTFLSVKKSAAPPTASAPG